MSEAGSKSRGGNLLRSGILFSAAGFLAGLGNYAFQAIISRNMEASGEYGLANSAFSLAMLLSLPASIATFAVTHYIARFNFAGEELRLHQLLAGCRKFLFRLTWIGSLFALLLVKPISAFFGFPRSSLVFTIVFYVLALWWGAFATALCQGLGWFKRLAAIGLGVVTARVALGLSASHWNMVAETVVLISAAGLLANLILLKWRKQLARPSDHPESPWTPEFINFIFISLACVGGGYCFMQGDQLVAKRYLGKEDLDAYTAAGLLARALPMTVGPLLTVLFTYRSGQHQADNLREQLKLLALYAGGLICGAAGLIALGAFCLKILNRYTPEVHAMLLPLSLTMVFVGLLQSLALWSLASRWSRLAIFYGILGLAYWLILLTFGTSLHVLLRLMPIAAGLAFAGLLVAWVFAMRFKRAVN